MSSQLRRRKSQPANPNLDLYDSSTAHRSIPIAEEQSNSVFVKLATVLFILLLVVYLETWYHDSSQPSFVREDQYSFLWYEYYIDMSLFTLVGFGFSMTYLRRYALSALSFTLLIAAVAIPYGCFAHEVVDYIFIGAEQTEANDGRLSGYHLSQGLLAAVTVLISYGVVVGRITASQLLCLIMLEITFWAFNSYLNVAVWGVYDRGNSINTSLFACYYGLGISWMLEPPIHFTHRKSMYHSDLFSLIGTLFLWLYFPSFNSFFANDEYYFRDRALVNTVLALCGSTFGTFFMSFLVTIDTNDGSGISRRKFDIRHVASSTITGGVAIGTAADLYLTPVGAISIGIVAAVVSVWGFAHFSDSMERRLHISDTRGIHNIHGLPAIWGACVAALALALSAHTALYVPPEHEYYPFAWKNLELQAAYTLVAMCTTIGIALLCGGVTGWILVLFRFPSNEFDDRESFRVFGKQNDKTAFYDTIRRPFFSLQRQNEDRRRRVASHETFEVDTIRAGNFNWNMDDEDDDDMLQATGIQVCDSLLGDENAAAFDPMDWRQCIENDVMPALKSIGHATILREYYFDDENEDDEDAKREEPDEDEMFYPSYCCAKVPANGDDGEYEYFITAKLNSNVQPSRFARRHLNLVLVVDIEGEIVADFASNKYEQMAQMITGLIQQQLTSSDRIGIVALSDTIQVLSPLQFCTRVDLHRMRNDLLLIGGTGGKGGKHRGAASSHKGYKTAVKLFDDAGIEASEKYENRIVFMTAGLDDADDGEDWRSQQYANDEQRRIYSTIIGIGIGLTTRYWQQRAMARGSNLLNTKSLDELAQFFRERDKFTYLVTPIFFNIVLKLKCLNQSCAIEQIYGSKNDKYNAYVVKKGNLLKIHTVFASNESIQIVKSGILLIKLKALKAEELVMAKISVSYEDREGFEYVNDTLVTLQHEQHTYFDSVSIRKSILLSRYAQLLLDWISEQRTNNYDDNTLKVNAEFKQKFERFYKYFDQEMHECQDKALDKELLVLQKLTC